MSTHCVVLADVVESREINDRPSFRSILQTALETVNSRYSETIVANFELLKGIDEFGGVLTDISMIYWLLRDLTEILHPVEVRFGVAIDRIDVGRMDSSVSNLDGPAFHRSDDLLATAKEEDLLIVIDTSDPVLDPLFLVGIDSLLRVRHSWTDRQIEIVRTYRREESQYDAAEALGVSQQAISKALSRANYKRVKTLERHLNRALEEAYGD